MTETTTTGATDGARYANRFPDPDLAHKLASLIDDPDFGRFSDDDAANAIANGFTDEDMLPFPDFLETVGIARTEWTSDYARDFAEGFIDECDRNEGGA